MLASNVQEELLFLPQVTEGRDPIAQRNLRNVSGRTKLETVPRVTRERFGSESGEAPAGGRARTELSGPGAGLFTSSPNAAPASFRARSDDESA